MVGRLGRRAQFEHLRAQGTTFREGQLRFVVAWPRSDASDDESGDGAAIAYAISRRNGSAVRRNRIRRRLRAVVAATEREGVLPDRWYLVTVLPSAREPGYAQLEDWFRKGLARLTRSDGARR